mmetsp:Transcript_1998/g.4433  ORF Transcript_1998/g.4433 Transcript_1998/m.4433 type:complete len:220 (+) Transcript_1998:51-710(+)
MASVTAASPSLAVFTVSRLCTFSSPRSVVVSLSDFCMVAIESDSSLFACSRPSFLASKELMSTESWLTSPKRKSRVLAALPSSVSQKPFLVASWAASFKSLSISCWTSCFTFLKGSETTWVASEDSILLWMRMPSWCKEAKALSTGFCMWTPTTLSDRGLTRGSLVAWKRDTATAAWGIRTMAASCHFRWMSNALLLTASSSSLTLFLPSTPSLRMAKA